jgi:hypothetical protein
VQRWVRARLRNGLGRRGHGGVLTMIRR